MTQENQQETTGNLHGLSGENQTTSLGTPTVNNSVAERILQDINEHTSQIYNDGHRWHLGASKIGAECKRALWYSFRWVLSTKVDGRRQRMFNRGHLEEKRHAEWLRGIGFTVWTHDESQVKEDGTHPQLRIKNKCRGHLGGSLDGIVQFPERYKINGYAILESKTSGAGAKFNNLSKNKMIIEKPDHYAQNSIYGASYNIDHVLYICANKNDDDLYIEVAKLDFKLAEQMELKAEAIVFSQEPPPKLSENPTFFTCKSLCDFKDICHAQAPIEKNCRSCKKCSAVDDAEFYCSHWDGVIPRSHVPAGCHEWVAIVGNIKIIVPPVSRKQIEAMPILVEDIPY